VIAEEIESVDVETGDDRARAEPELGAEDVVPKLLSSANMPGSLVSRSE
jgi:hypothetical protein